jgi:signal transduction histidine kinase/ActR/RegA family two-component response regulator
VFDGDYATFLKLVAAQVSAAILAAEMPERKETQEREHALSMEQSARQMAASANRMKDEFLATLSHELRTPLNAIIGWVDILLKGQYNPSVLSHAVEVIHRNARAQAQLIEDMLDASRIITGKFHLDMHPTKILSTVDAAVESVRPLAEAKGISLSKAFDISAGEVLGDRVRLQQVVWNLLSNAIKFTPRGGSVDVRVGRAGDHVEIIVSDTGQGIGSDVLPYVFDRFRQVDSSYARKQGGLGLGLAIVRHLTELHGGRVEARSAGEGLGAMFKVRLPLMAAKRGAPRSQPQARNLPARSKDRLLEGVRILLVDDHADTREMLSVVLRDNGADVKLSSSAGEALEALKSWRPDILVSDIGMPGEDGYSLLNKVRRLDPDRGGNIPALALTGYAGLGEGERALLAGYQLHLAKPIEPDELILALAQLAGRLDQSA